MELFTRSSKLVTVLFADVANYTPISEGLDPEEVQQLMKGCFQILMDEIHKCEGTINQFTGDGVMAIFGAPVAHEDHAQRACHAALAIQKALNPYAEGIQNDRHIDFKMRIGLNSGPVVVAIGDDLRIPETVEGIIAARIDRLEENLKQTMQTASVIGREFAFRIMSRITDRADILKSCLFDLQSLEFIYEKRLFPELEYVFKHALIQEVAYKSVLLNRRKEIHEKIGAAIEEIYADRLEMFYEMLAYHYSRSSNYRKACHFRKGSA